MEYTILFVENRQPIWDLFQQIEWGSEFIVKNFSSGEEGLLFLQEQPAHLIYVGNQLPDMDVIQFIDRKNQLIPKGRIPVVIISDEPDYKIRIQQMVEAADDYILFPFDPPEVEIRARILLREVYHLDEFSQKAAKGFAGGLSEMNLLDLLQTMELGRKTGVIHLQRGEKEAFVYVSDGIVSDAEIEALLGEEALFRLFTWTEGHFSVEFAPVERERNIQLSSQEITLRGMKIFEEWQRLRGHFPDLSVVPQLQEDIQMRELEEDWKQVIPLLDGARSLKRILGMSPLSEVQTLEAIRQLQMRGYLEEMEIKVKSEWLTMVDSGKNGKYQVDFHQVKQSIQSFIAAFTGRKTEPGPETSAMGPPGGGDGQSKTRIRPKIIFDKVELQYMKQKLL